MYHVFVSMFFSLLFIFLLCFAMAPIFVFYRFSFSVYDIMY
jgi:hypothetical protein